jgi:hypothetical protein
LEYSYRPPKVAQPSASGYSGGYLLIAVLSVISIVTAAAGVSSLTGLPLLVCAFLAGIVYATKMYFIRPQVQYEELIEINWDKMAFYLITAFIFVTLAAFGLYCLNCQDDPATDNVRRFLRETVAMDTYALGYWFLPAVLEILIVLLIFHNRTRYEYWD